MIKPCSIALVFLLLAAILSGEEQRKNVLFLVADDLRTELGCYRGIAQTPNLDALAARGLRFDRAYCQKALCWPSRNSFFSGLAVDHLGAASHEETFRVSHPQVESLPQWFRSHGWETAGFGKILHDGQVDSPSWTEPFFEPPPLPYALEKNRHRHPIINRLDPANKANPLVESAAVDDDAYSDGLTTTAAIEALRDLARRDRPFFMMVGFHKPHSPFAAPKRYWDLYDRDAIPLAGFRGAPSDSPERFVSHRSRYLRSFAGFPDEGPVPDAAAREAIHGYLACVSYIDALTGRILAELESSGAVEDTIVVFTSDHGYHLGDHGLWSKHTTFETATRVPLLFAGPGIAKDASSSALVELLDLFPTLCDLSALDEPGHLAGTSFAPVLADPTTGHRETAYSEFTRGGATGRSIRTAEYRYTEWREVASGELVATEYYDHLSDAGETKNLAGTVDLERPSRLLRERTK